MFPNYNVMGVAKAALESSGALPGGRSRAAEHPRQHDLGRPREDAGRLGHLRASRRFCRSIAIAPRSKRNIDGSDVAGVAMFLLSDLGKGVTGEVIYVDAGYRPMGM